MSDLIERESVIKIAYSRIDGIDRLYGQSHPDSSDWEYAIDNAPTVDTVQAADGHWDVRGRYFKCSHCKVAIASMEEMTHCTGNKWNYCPNCGAKMDGDTICE